MKCIIHFYVYVCRVSSIVSAFLMKSIFTLQFLRFMSLFSLSLTRTIYFSATHLCTHTFAHRARSFLYYLRFHIYITYSTTTLIRNISESSGFIFVFALLFVENSSLFQFIVQSKFLWKIFECTIHVLQSLQSFIFLLSRLSSLEKSRHVKKCNMLFWNGAVTESVFEKENPWLQLIFYKT